MNKKATRKTASHSNDSASSQTARQESGWHSLFDRISATKRHGMAVLVLVLVSVAFYAPIHFSGKQIIAGDTINWRGMAQSMIEYEEETGDVALWAGRTFVGMPGYMISPELTVPQVDSVMKVLRDWIWPTSNLMLMFLGMYCLAFLVTKDTLASLVGAIAYGLSTYMPVILVAGHNSKFIALAWAPWLLAAFIYVLKKPTLLAALLFAVAAAANLRAGHVQITYYVTFAAGIWWIVEGVGALKSKETAQFVKATGLLVLGSFFGLLMVAEPYLAHAELAPYTTRGSGVGGAVGGMGWEYAMDWSQGVSELWTLLIADAFGGAGASYWGPKIFTGGPHHFGAIVLVFALFGAWKCKDRTNLALVIGIAVLTLFSLGEHAAFINRPMFNYFPMFSAFRVPETWLSVVAILVALLAARGVSSVLKNEFKLRKITSNPALQVAGGVVGLLVLLMVFGTSLFSFEKPQEREELFSQIARQYPTISSTDPQVVSVIDEEISTRKATRVALFDADTKRVALFVIALSFLLVLLVRGTLPPWVAGFGIILLASLELGSVGHRYLNEEVLSSESSVEEKIQQFGFDTFLLSEKAREGGDGAFRVLSLEFGRDPNTNARPSYFYESLGGYSAAKLRVFQDFMDHVLFTGTGTGINMNALNIANVRYIVAGQGVPGMNPVYQDEQTGMVVYENSAALDRAFLVDQVVSVASAEEAWSILNAPTFRPHNEAIVINAPENLLATNTTDGVSVTDSLGVSSNSVTMSNYTAQHIQLNVTTDRDRLLVISEVYYAPGWTAWVGGVETPIYQVNQLFRGVVLPAGTHDVELKFSPPSFIWGRRITAAGTMVVYGLLLLLGWFAYQRRSKEALIS